MTAPILVLCLGNEVLSDDGFGAVVADQLNAERSPNTEVEVVFVSLAGFSLLQLLENRTHVLVVDTMVTGKYPKGSLRLLSSGAFTPSRSLTTSHQISLPTAIKLGELFGCTMPDSIDVLVIEAQDVETLSEELTPPIAAAVPEAIRQINRWISIQIQEETHVRKTAG